MTETLPPGFMRYRVLPEDSRRLDEAEEPHFYVTVGSAPKPPTAEERVAAVWQSLGERDHFDWTAGIIDTAHTDIYGVLPVDLFEDNIHIGDEDTFPDSAELVASVVTKPTGGEFTNAVGGRILVAPLPEPLSLGTNVQFDSVLVLSVVDVDDLRRAEVVLTAEDRASLIAILTEKETDA
jgi:hypothetical protein